MNEILSVKSIIKKYDNRTTAVNNVSLDIVKNTFTTLIGQSGSGKSTLLNIMSGLLAPTSGSIIYNNKNITKFSDSDLSEFRRNDIGQIFQNYYLLSNLTVEENIKIGFIKEKRGYSLKELVSILGIENLLNKFPSELSGGQKQRVAIARALIKNPDILFCDEATGALDEENSKNVIALLHELKVKYGLTIIFITHNYEIAKTSERIITIKNGEIYKDKLNTNPILPSQMSWN
ncbi:ABC transporter ATP-binding protein [Clostridium sp. YIM B02569]|uniref:ABC transporter ATP-binding protein n=1 Tax=Clostridium sp. YIM B02569 TaxID=2911967 RepID=UPI001EEA65F4|nr:ABC transporter ATP-binding protein [Clostridium sp. YIM B02569]